MFINKDDWDTPIQNASEYYHLQRFLLILIKLEQINLYVLFCQKKLICYLSLHIHNGI